ncbi:unnamed protein product [Prorocentrum cordatum]|uniref:Uncharacterized protein n=1 Tax=Prorocentrum cordatum TaxID=2364126 RepID=A0ABN9TVU2_9DINO|nr:unnamed protein product [Polarella glacialis]
MPPPTLWLGAGAGTAEGRHRRAAPRPGRGCRPASAPASPLPLERSGPGGAFATPRAPSEVSLGGWSARSGSDERAPFFRHGICEDLIARRPGWCPEPSGGIPGGGGLEAGETAVGEPPRGAAEAGPWRVRFLAGISKQRVHWRSSRVDVPCHVGAELRGHRRQDAWTVVTEVCHGCHGHAMSTRHDPEQYLHAAHTIVREGLQLALKGRAPEVESRVLLTTDLCCRVGCLEVFLLPPVEHRQHAVLLHSKLISRIFPTAEGLSRKLLLGMAAGSADAKWPARCASLAEGAGTTAAAEGAQAELPRATALSRAHSAPQQSCVIAELEPALEFRHTVSPNDEEPLVGQARGACLGLRGLRDELARARGERDAAAMHAALREAERAQLPDGEAALARAELEALCWEARTAVQRRDVVRLGQALEGWCIPQAAQLPRASEGSADALHGLAAAARKLRQWVQACSSIHNAFESVVASQPQERRARLAHLVRQLEAAHAQGLRLPPAAEAAWRKALCEGMAALSVPAAGGGPSVVTRLRESAMRKLTMRLQEALGGPLSLAALESAAHEADRLGVAAAAGPSADDTGGPGQLVAEVQRCRAALRALRARLEGALDALLGSAAPTGGLEPSAGALAALVEEAGRCQARSGALGFDDPSVAAGRAVLSARGLQVRRHGGHLLVRLGAGGAPPWHGASEAASAEVLTSRADELSQRTTTDQGGWCFVPPGAEEFDILLLGEPGLRRAVFHRASLRSWQVRELEPDLGMLRVLRASDPPLRYAVSLGGPAAAPKGWRPGTGVPLALIGEDSGGIASASQPSPALRRRLHGAAAGAPVAVALSRGRRPSKEVGAPQDYTDDGGWCRLKDPSAGAVRLWPPLDGQRAYQPVDVVIASLPTEVELPPARSPSGGGTPSSAASASFGSATEAGSASLGSFSTAGQTVQDDHTCQPIGLEGQACLPDVSSSLAARRPSQLRLRLAERAASSPRPLPAEATASPRQQPTELTLSAHSARAAVAETLELSTSPSPAGAALAEPPVEESESELAAFPGAAVATASASPAEARPPARQPQPEELPYPAFIAASTQPAEGPAPSPQPSELTASRTPRRAELTSSPRPPAAAAAEQGAPSQQRADSDGQQPTELTLSAHSAQAPVAETPELSTSPSSAGAVLAEPPVEESEFAAFTGAAVATASATPAEALPPARQPQLAELPYPASIAASTQPAEGPAPSLQARPSELTASRSPRQAELTTSPRPPRQLRSREPPASREQAATARRPGATQRGTAAGAAAPARQQGRARGRGAPQPHVGAEPRQGRAGGAAGGGALGGRAAAATPRQPWRRRRRRCTAVGGGTVDVRPRQRGPHSDPRDAGDLRQGNTPRVDAGRAVPGGRGGSGLAGGAFPEVGRWQRLALRSQA